jgi:hypothetical protein
MDNGKIMVPSERIEQSILLIRWQKVMLDNDLAALSAIWSADQGFKPGY